MNAMLRGETLEIEAFSKAVLTLGAALGTAEAPADMLLYRGASAGEGRFYRQLAPGATTRSRAFISTSIQFAIARSFAGMHRGGVVVELMVRRGCRGVAYVNPFPARSHIEYEVLINQAISLKVLQPRGHTICLEVMDDDHG